MAHQSPMSPPAVMLADMAKMAPKNSCLSGIIVMLFGFLVVGLWWLRSYCESYGECPYGCCDADPYPEEGVGSEFSLKEFLGAAADCFGEFGAGDYASVFGVGVVL